jgi:hypothetical protein
MLIKRIAAMQSILGSQWKSEGVIWFAFWFPVMTSQTEFKKRCLINLLCLSIWCRFKQVHRFQRSFKWSEFSQTTIY